MLGSISVFSQVESRYFFFIRNTVSFFSVPSSSLFCELCNVTCSDLGGYNQHLKGKRHADNASGKSEQVFKCEPCQMDFQNKDSLIIHNVGDGHKLAVSKLADASGSGGAKIIDYAQIEGEILVNLMPF